MRRAVHVSRLQRRQVVPMGRINVLGNISEARPSFAFPTLGARKFSTVTESESGSSDVRVTVGVSLFEISSLQVAQGFSCESGTRGIGLCAVASNHVRGTREFGVRVRPDAAEWLQRRDGDVRRFLEQLFANGAALHPDLRICITGTAEDLAQTPWECSLVLMSAKYIEKDSLIASMPLSVCNRSALVSNNKDKLLANTNIPLSEVHAAVSLSSSAGSQVSPDVACPFPLKYVQGELKSPDGSFNEDIIRLFNQQQMSPCSILQKHPEWNASTVLQSLVFSKVVPVEEAQRSLSYGNGDYIFNILETAIVHRKYQPIIVHSKIKGGERLTSEDQGSGTVLAFVDHQYQLPVPGAYVQDQPAYQHLSDQVYETVQHQASTTPSSKVLEHLGRMIEVPSFVAELLDGEAGDGKKTSYLSVPLLALFRPAVRPTTRNVALQFGADEDETGNVVPVVQAVARGDIIPLVPLCTQWVTALMDKYTGEQTAQPASLQWGGSDEPAAQPEIVEENLIPDFRPVSLSEALVCYNEGVYGSSDLKVDPDALQLRLEALKSSLSYWHADYLDKGLSITTEFTNNDVNGWKRVVGPSHATKQMYGAEGGSNVLVRMNINKHMALNAADTALGMFCQQRMDYCLDIPHQTQAQVEAMRQYHRAAVGIIKTNFPDLFAANEIKSSDVRARTREIQRANTVGSVIAFTGCSLLLDIGRSIFGLSIPSISLRILDSLVDDPLWGSEHGNRALLTGALPSYDTVANEYRNTTRNDILTIQGYIKTISRTLHTLKEDHPTQFMALKSELGEILVQLKASKVALETRFQVLMLWRNLYAYAYRQFTQVQ